MPELPEVETIRMQLDKVLRGLVIEDIGVLREKSFVVPLHSDVVGITRELRGMSVVGVRRRAKIQFIELENGTSLAIHLKMTGQLIFKDSKIQRFKDPKTQRGEDIDIDSRLRGNDKGKIKANIYNTEELPNKYTRVIITFSDGSKLYFNDLRVFGWIKVIESTTSIISTTGTTSNEDKYGPEAIDEETFTLEYFQKMLSKTSRAVKLAILDQEKLAGVGNIYANEALFRAGIRPDKESKILRSKEIKILREEIIKVLREAIEHGGTSDKDEAFRQIDGSKGGYQKFLQVYNREGEKCLRCSTPIKKVKVGGRGTYYCSSCQK